jgi:hypothetical protein
MDAERRLATLAAHLVLDCGVEAAQEQLLAAARRAEVALQRIALVSGSTASPLGKPCPAFRLGPRQKRRAGKLAREFEHVARSSAAPAEDVVGVRTVRALAACQQDAEAEALQLFMLLALTREKRGGCPLTRQDLLGRQLVVLLLSEQRAYHYFGAVAQRNLQAPSHLHR